MAALSGLPSRPPAMDKVLEFLAKWRHAAVDWTLTGGRSVI
ncbi:MAG TPA: hypothetical protein VKD45_07935 [Hyphomicrobiaceae bacterium]|nr:hypothetical protein [Hyphomicrobiaceae bacterium]